ncbi:MAG: hydrogenase nickel incorporation protein HypB [candidate division NC10 bacterium]|nr:hydrogenase nickel incorporation protein HypB [candidate division NC10 bacterium]
MEIRLAEDLLEANNRQAERVKAHLSQKGIFTLNLLSSPGAGKTTLIERTLQRLKGVAKTAVIVGDVQTSRDKQRFEEAGWNAVQINTEGGCHLTAGMVERALASLDLDDLDLLFIENVGNLVCPAGFQLGEDMKVVLLSTTEGDDKPGKYPAAFLHAEALVITKIDLLPWTNFRLDFARKDALQIHPQLKIFEVSSLKGEGMKEWVDWILQRADGKRRDGKRR